MEFFETYTEDGMRLLGLVSKAELARALIVHIHGYGGDMLSNAFVRTAHSYLPQCGISFLSFNLRTAAYITEVYDETSVAYAGASLADQDDTTLDIDAVLAACRADAPEIVLQGHSFGTNIVKRYARRHAQVEKVVLLSPADSVALYEQWRAEASPEGTPGDDTGSEVVRWDLFGIASGAARYPLPITARNFQRLFRGESFNEWSKTDAIMGKESLVVIGGDDPISNYGNTGNEAFLRKCMPSARLEYVSGARHVFSDFEERICEHVARWILENPAAR